MKIWGVPKEELVSIAEENGLIFTTCQGGEPKQVGKAVQGVLRPGVIDGVKMYQRHIVHNGRRINAVCAHGHYAFMLTVFNLYPDARIQSSWADYRGERDFNAKAVLASSRNVGSAYRPVEFGDTCDCETKVMKGR